MDFEIDNLDNYFSIQKFLYSLLYILSGYDRLTCNFMMIYIFVPTIAYPV